MSSNPSDLQASPVPESAQTSGKAQCAFYLDQLTARLGCEDLRRHLAEIEERGELISDFETAVRDEPRFETKHFPDIYDFRFYRIVLYALTREFRPNLFIETGVMHGLSSQFILHALRRNGNGRLISIDLPSYAETGPANKDGYVATLPPGREPGWAVSRKYHGLWTLKTGKSLDVLPRVLEETGPVDMFLHDSEHTYETMWGEFSAVWDFLRPGGFLICDNLDANTSFFDFCQKVGRAPSVFPNPNAAALFKIQFGLIRK